VGVSWGLVEQPLDVGNGGGQNGAGVDSGQELGCARMIEVTDLEAELGLREGIVMASIPIPFLLLVLFFRDGLVVMSDGRGRHLGIRLWKKGGFGKGGRGWCGGCCGLGGREGIGHRSGFGDDGHDCWWIVTQDSDQRL